MTDVPDQSSFLARHEFLLRRLHSLSGVIPVGAYMVVHLLTNASVNNGAETFQRAVYQIHSLGVILPVVEWVFIFLPILFHAIYGVVIIRSGQPNSGTYRYGANWRYSAQRVTGMIAFAFILWHVLHMHGWIHAQWWIDGLREMGHAQFAPYNAASSAALAMKAPVVQLLYAIGVLSCVFHLANGIWTFGITWGIWISPEAQRKSLLACGGFGVLLAIVGLSAIAGFAYRVPADASKTEDEMYDARVATHEISPDDHKRAAHKKPGTTAHVPPLQTVPVPADANPDEPAEPSNDK